MPEGPEVTHMVKLMQSFIGCKIISANILSGRYKKSKPKGWTLFKKSLPATISHIHNKGKFIYFVLNSSLFMFNSLGMTGSWTIDDSPYNKLIFNLNCNHTQLFLLDVRNFATIKFTRADPLNKLNKIGYDAISKSFSFDDLYNALHKAKKSVYWNRTISEFLLSQKFISGLGTYMISDSLYASKLSPKRKVRSLSHSDIRNLYNGIKKISKESLHSQKFSLHMNNNIENYNKYKFKIYKDPIAKKFAVKNRNIYWNPDTQH
jgi:formamidopyrimidine-DNA glycosylase